MGEKFLLLFGRHPEMHPNVVWRFEVAHSRPKTLNALACVDVRIGFVLFATPFFEFFGLTAN